MSGLELAAGIPPGSSKLSLTEDGSKLFYVNGRSFSNLWSLGAQGGVQPLTTGTAMNSVPSVSPDGQWVAYKSTVAGRTNVFVVPSEGGPPRQLTHVDSVSGYPVWSPDGTSVAFGVRRGGGNHVAIVNAAGRGTIKVLEATALSGNGTIEWAPGPEILYQRPGLRNFHFLDPDSGVERPLLSADSAAVGFALQVRYSPDQSQVVVLRNRSPRSEAGLYVISLAEGVHRRLTTQPDVSPIGWSEDGRTVYALSTDRRAVLAVPEDGGMPTVVESLPWEANRVGTTYGGRWFVFESSEATGDVWRIESFDPSR